MFLYLKNEVTAQRVGASQEKVTSVTNAENEGQTEGRSQEQGLHSMNYEERSNLAFNQFKIDLQRLKLDFNQRGGGKTVMAIKSGNAHSDFAISIFNEQEKEVNVIKPAYVEVHIDDEKWKHGFRFVPSNQYNTVIMTRYWSNHPDQWGKFTYFLMTSNIIRSYTDVEVADDNDKSYSAFNQRFMDHTREGGQNG